MTFEEAPVKLTIGEIVRAGWVGFIDNFSMFFQVTFVPIIVFGILTAASYFLSSSLKSLIELLQCIVWISFTSSWRRHLILGEKPRTLYFGDGFWGYFSRIFLAYIGFMIVTGIITLIPFGLGISHWFSEIQEACKSASGIRYIWDSAIIIFSIIIIMGISSLPGLWLIMRHAPYFSAKCISDQDLTLRRSSCLMKGNVMPLVVGVFVANLPLYLLTPFLLFGNISVSVLMVLSIINMFLVFVSIGLNGSIGAYIYQKLVHPLSSTPCAHPPLRLN